MPVTQALRGMLVSSGCAFVCAMLALATPAARGAGALLPSSPESYLTQAARVRQSNDRPWAPDAGQLGNLRHLQITAKDCVVRVVSGNENRVFPGTSSVIAVEGSRALDADQNEQPAPRDVVLATDRAQACPGLGSCGVSVTSVTHAPSVNGTDAVCFTVQIATAHDVLLGGDGLNLLVDRVRQPALRIALNPGYRMKIWLQQVELGLLSINANAPAKVGGGGKVDFLQLGSSNGASAMFMHGINARHVGVSTTTTGTQWSIGIGAETQASYYQPARAPGPLAENYTIEIDGPLERLQVPAGRVSARPLSEATRTATRALRDEVLARAGPPPTLPTSDVSLPSAAAVAVSLPLDSRQRVAQVVARYLPASIRITDIALWKKGGRLEGIAPDAASARDIVRLLTNSGEFVYVSGGGGTPRDGGYWFSTQLNFSCDAPGEPSVCPAGEPALPSIYSTKQVRDRLAELLGPTVTLLDVRLNRETIEMKADAPSEIEARAGLERIRQGNGLFSLSTSTFGPSAGSSSTDISATLKLTCAVPPKADGICAPRSQ